MANQSRLPSFLLTRPSAQSQRFAEALRQRFGAGLQIVISPLMEPEFPMPQVPAGPFSALVFTSEAGVAAYSQQPEVFPLTSKTAYCVGDRTAKAAELAGLDPVSADGDANALIGLLLALQPAGQLLHLCGAETRGDVAVRLTQADIPTVACISYRQVQRPLTLEAANLLQGESAVVVPLFSPRSAAIFLAEIEKLSSLAPVTCAVLSKAVAEPLLSKPVGLVYAEQPKADALLNCIAGVFDATQMP